MNKTPVSILQEMMVKQKMIPDYVLTHDGGGTHMNTFTYQVSCEGLSATGTGRTKKDAKHKAAKAMLETIAAHRGYPQLPPTPAQSPVRTPIPVAVPSSPKTGANVPFINAVGELQALCVENSLEDPQYIPISDEGPPHARIFTYQCVLSTFKEEGVATTKKQAKHEAARKMWTRLKDLIDDASLFNDKIKNNKVKIHNIISDEIAKARYVEISKLPLKKSNLGLKITSYHTKLKQFFETDECKEFIEYIQSLLSNDKIKHIEGTIDSILNNFNSLLEKLDVEVTVETLNVYSADINCVCLRMTSAPVILQCGIGKTEFESKCDAFNKLLNTVMLMIK